METQELSGKLIEVLDKMYGMAVFTNLMEFCQGELRVLLWLDEPRQDEERIPSVMADAMGVTRGRMTAAIASLKRKGYVEHHGSSRDRRKLIISLTDSGREYVARRRQQAEGFISDFIEQVGEQRARELTETLSLICR